MTRSGSVPSLDLKSFLPSSQDDEQQIENMHQVKKNYRKYFNETLVITNIFTNLQMIYWEWKQYMESCVLLLQVAANVFTSITSTVVLKEVLTSAQGYNFLISK